jgi:predicted nucleotidyltransferase
MVRLAGASVNRRWVADLDARPPCPARRCPALYGTMPVVMADQTTLDRGLAERERILAQLRAQAPRLRARGIQRLSLFRSMARAEGGSGSDVDLLIEVDPTGHFRLFDLVDLQDDLRGLFGRRAHFAFASKLPPWLRHEILAETIAIF